MTMDISQLSWILSSADWLRMQAAAAAAWKGKEGSMLRLAQRFAGGVEGRRLCDTWTTSYGRGRINEMEVGEQLLVCLSAVICGHFYSASFVTDGLPAAYRGGHYGGPAVPMD